VDEEGLTVMPTTLPPVRQLTLATLGFRYERHAGVWAHPDVPFTLSDYDLEELPAVRWRLLVTTLQSQCPLCARPLWP
jgi:hypothetical protein